MNFFRHFCIAVPWKIYKAPELINFEKIEELGAAWGGPIGPDGVDPLFTDGDVLVVPRLGEDGSPFVARRAQAAGLPVVAPRTEALSEVVRDELDGVLFTGGRWRRSIQPWPGSPRRSGS